MGTTLRRKMIAEDGPGWAVTDYDGNPKPGRWATKADATQEGYLGVYLLSGIDVVEVRPDGEITPTCQCGDYHSGPCCDGEATEGLRDYAGALLCTPCAEGIPS